LRGMSRWYIGIEMKKSEIAKKMARQSGVSHAEAADRLDRVVHQILSNLRKGKQTSLPGLGRLLRDPDGTIHFEGEEVQ
jgi:hypothetical protein